MHNGQVVFVVDDEPAVAKAISRLLRATGYTTQVFGSAREFMDCFVPGTSGCLVVDFSMPGLGGLDLQQWLADSAYSLPVVFLTGMDDIPETVRAMMSGAVAILTKPVTADALIESVEAALARTVNP